MKHLPGLFAHRARKQSCSYRPQCRHRRDLDTFARLPAAGRIRRESVRPFLRRRGASRTANRQSFLRARRSSQRGGPLDVPARRSRWLPGFRKKCAAPAHNLLAPERGGYRCRPARERAGARDCERTRIGEEVAPMIRMTSMRVKACIQKSSAPSVHSRERGDGLLEDAEQSLDDLGRAQLLRRHGHPPSASEKLR